MREVKETDASCGQSQLAAVDATSCSYEYESAKVAAVARPLQIRCRDAVLSWRNPMSTVWTLLLCERSCTGYLRVQMQLKDRRESPHLLRPLSLEKGYQHERFEQTQCN